MTATMPPRPCFVAGDATSHAPAAASVYEVRDTGRERAAGYAGRPV
jgi:hypothetical protein